MTVANHIDADVVVVGGGPAGSVFATRMVQLGFDVCLIERSRFPRPRLGESLSPGVLPMLASIGSAAVIEAARFPRVRSVSVRWDGDEVMRDDPREQGMLVDRGAFDAALLAKAREIGAQVLHPAVLRAHVATPDEWQLSVDAPSGPVEIHAAFLADASGRAARLGGTRRAMGPRTIAVHGYWAGPGLPQRPRIEAGAREWFWGVPIPDGSYNTLVFVDGERFRAEPAESLDDRLVSLLRGSALHDDVRGARLRAPARAADATPYVDEECVSARWIRVGDAGLALDPLSSSGVQKAIQSALSGAIVANTLLRRPEASDGALRFYRDSLHNAAERHQAWARAHYASAAASRPDAFWTDRAGATAPAALDSAPGMVSSSITIGDDVPLQLSPVSRWEELPCLGPQYVEMRTALRHPRLDGPVAYVGGQELAPLLRDVRPGLTSRQLAHLWSGRVPPGAGLSIVRWLAGHGVLEQHPAPSPWSDATDVTHQ
jgi:flavin-dependent dehydrogenase